MRTEILRSPETDRKKVLIPTTLTDMTDYAARLCGGLISATGLPDPGCPLFQQPFHSQAYSVTAEELVLTSLDPASAGVTQGANGLIVPSAGLYLLTAVVFWSSYSANCGLSTIPPPDLDKRTSLILAGTSYSVPLVTAVAGDTLTTMLPMGAGDEARISVYNNDTVNTVGPVLYASLSLARVA